MKRFRGGAVLGAVVFCCAALGGGGGRVSAQGVTYQFQRTNSEWAATSTSTVQTTTGQISTQTNSVTPNASGATVGSTASLYLGPNTWGTSQNQISAVPNPDLQSILQFSGLLQSQLEVKDDPATPPFIWAWGNMAAPPDGNNTSGTVTSTLNITPTTATGTAVLKIDLLWMIYQSNPQTSATNTGFSVRVSSSCDATPLTVFANRLEDGTVTIGGDDNLAPGTYFITPGGDGVSITRTLNNVAHGCTFTIQVRPYTETDQIFPGQQGSVDVDLAIDARVTVTN